jgi:hypothetical protein
MALGKGYLSPRGLHGVREPGGRTLLLETQKDMLKRYIKRDVKCPLIGYLSP